MFDEPRYLLIVKVTAGLTVRDTPRPASEGGQSRRVVPVGSQLYAYSIHNIGGVPYALLVPQNPNKPEWVRVREREGLEYCDVLELIQPEQDLAAAIRELAAAFREFKAAFREFKAA
jgi:hypothetical protein